MEPMENVYKNRGMFIKMQCRSNNDDYGAVSSTPDDNDGNGNPVLNQSCLLNENWDALGSFDLELLDVASSPPPLEPIEDHEVHENAVVNQIGIQAGLKRTFTMAKEQDDSDSSSLQSSPEKICKRTLSQAEKQELQVAGPSGLCNPEEICNLAEGQTSTDLIKGPNVMVKLEPLSPEENSREIEDEELERLMAFLCSPKPGRCPICNSQNILQIYVNQKIIACSKCISFFRKYIIHGHSEILKCPLELGQCDILSDPEPYCKLCRLYMCFKIGFTLEGPARRYSEKERELVRMEQNNNLPPFPQPKLKLLIKIFASYSSAFHRPSTSVQVNKRFSYMEEIKISSDNFSYPTLFCISEKIIDFVIKIKGEKIFSKLSSIQIYDLVSLLLVFHALRNFPKLRPTTHEYIMDRIKQLGPEPDDRSRLGIFLYNYKKIGHNFMRTNMESVIGFDNLDQTEEILCWAVLASLPMIEFCPEEDIQYDETLLLLAHHEFDPENQKPPNRFSQLVQQLRLVKALGWHYFCAEAIALAFAGYLHSEEQQKNLLSIFEEY